MSDPTNSYSSQRAPEDLIVAHMSTIQGLITRFAANSAACKNMCLTLVVAVLALLAANKTPDTLKITYAITGLMAWLDAYYLSMERSAVNLSKISAGKIQDGTFTYGDLFKISIGGKGWSALTRSVGALLSHSIWPFYGVLLACLLTIQVYFAGIR